MASQAPIMPGAEPDSAAAAGTAGAAGVAGVAGAGASVRVRLGVASDASVLISSNIAIALQTEQLTLDPAVVTRGVQHLLCTPHKGFYLIAETVAATPGGSVFAGSLLVTYEWSDWRAADIHWIQSVFVQEAFRGQGVYQMMYSEVLRLARAAGAAPTVRLYVEHDNERAKRAYQKCGMQQSHYLMYEADLAAEWKEDKL